MAIVLSWNVAGRVRAVADQAAALAQRPADVVALQEVRSTAVAAWESELARIGFEHILMTLPAGAAQRAPERRLGVLVAARGELGLGPTLAIPWPERHLAVEVEIEGVVTELLNLHAPVSSKPGLAKVLTLEMVYEHLRSETGQPRVLVGDLNTPQYESRDGEVRSFARNRAGRIRPTHGERHDAAELGVTVGLQKLGYLDAFRFLHGYDRRDRSWLYPNGKLGYRLDHVLARGMNVLACEYEHSWREQGLSDHSAIWAELQPRGATPE